MLLFDTVDVERFWNLDSETLNQTEFMCDRATHLADRLFDLGDIDVRDLVFQGDDKGFRHCFVDSC